MKLYVVTTSLPGPGAEALIGESVKRNTIKPDAATWDAAVDALQGACEFVELEDADGHSYGPETGIDWEDHPLGSLKRIGPFLSAETIGMAIGRLYGCLIDPADLEQVPDEHREQVRAGLEAGSIGPEAFPPDVFLATWENCIDAIVEDQAARTAA